MNIQSMFGRSVKLNVPKEYSFDEALGKIKETAELAADCGYEPEKLHCRGCINGCALSRPRCDLGKRVIAAIEKR